MQVYFLSCEYHQKKFKLKAKWEEESACPSHVPIITWPPDNTNLKVTTNVGNDNKVLLTEILWNLSFSGDRMRMTLNSW